MTVLKPRPLTEVGPGTKLGKEGVRASPDPVSDFPNSKHAYLGFFKGLSKREWLALHAEIKAMQDQYGLSYKDSAHRVYLAEQARLQALTNTHNAVLMIRERGDKILDHEIVPVMVNLEERENTEK